MILACDDIFYLNTKQSTYVLGITKYGHVEHLYYGPTIKQQKSSDVLRLKRNAMIGSTVIYHEEDPFYSLDHLLLEWSGVGRGDYRYSPFVGVMPDSSYVSDFVYLNYDIVDNVVAPRTLPSAYGQGQTLILHLKDQSNDILLDLYYTVFESTNVITRRVTVINQNTQPLIIKRAMSMMLDLCNQHYNLTTFDGGWIKEMKRTTSSITPGIHMQSSLTGASSNKHNPGILVSSHDATQEQGHVYGFNLVYSGNHASIVERDNHDLLRISMGINDHCFEWPLKQNECFETPEVVMSFSEQGFNGLSQNMHDFINHHIIRGDYKGQPRPVLLNNWEAYFFDYNQKKLIHLASQAKALGVELFVLDDGWFSNRNSDQAGLGDYHVNRKKFPGGMKKFASKIEKLGMKFGLWVEPEMVNIDSDLYRKHPEYALTLQGKSPTLGRHQLVLNLCLQEVQDYIVESLSKLLDESPISYVKWDMNRHISEFFSQSLEHQGMFFHTYMLSLYRILERVFYPRPHILLETCSSGGNRFDLGMLCFSPQIWASDNTDPIERLSIQDGLSYLYPMSTIGAHVSASTHQQTLRKTPLSTRFNVAAFGLLGYEMDLKYLTKIEKQEIKDQINFYKQHRDVLQYGTFSRIETVKDNKKQWQVVNKDKTKALSGFYQTLTTASESFDLLKVVGLDDDLSYTVTTKPQLLYIKQFGELIKHLLPINLDPNGMILNAINKRYRLQDAVETYTVDGQLLKQGIHLNQQYMGTGYEKTIRLLSDFGSNLYLIEKEGMSDEHNS